MKTPTDLLSRSRAVAVLAALGVMAALVTAGPAEATSPGDNGAIAFKGYLDADRSTERSSRFGRTAVRLARSPSPTLEPSTTSLTGLQTER